MKKAHKLISAVLVSTMVLSMTACGSGEKTYKVGILQQLEHPALDQATQGFQDALTKLMGDSVTFDVQNAQGEQANCATIANNFVAGNYDLIRHCLCADSGFCIERTESKRFTEDPDQFPENIDNGQFHHRGGVQSYF